jgi:predicted house-cleaning noncanonical NTP pyrophosphatase (MazG superfamily)
LREFFEEASRVDTTAHIGVVVQQYIKPLLSGHLSNARRVAEEYRDGVVEVVNDASGAMAEERVSFRRWRRSKGASTDALVCPGPDDLLPVLREPLAFAALATKRVHYEWLWDGRFVHVVQADQEPERQSGASPESFVPPAPSSSAPIVLRLFKQAEHADGAASGKLRNHFRYADDGFAQPPIYVLREPEVLSHVLSGSVDRVLLSDLEALTVRPLVIRTSAASKGATLLPRSDVLQSASEASAWLTGPFADEIKRRGITADGVMLIAHHFIPALAAAFSTGSPDKREVYIEALWGIPEGLYYYPCDAYLVDTLSPDASDLPERQKANYEIWEERRFKGEFVAPNAEGRFVVSTTLRPWDWRSTISDKAVLRDIAHYTRKTAAREGQRIKMMWFLQCAPWTGLPPTLPWFHDNEAEDWKTAGSSYQRDSRDETISLRTRDDLRQLETKAVTGYKPKSGRRLVIRVNPVEHLIIRDEAVAERVGKAGAQLDAVVELQGGILSHVYYTLKRTGANVAVRNPPSFGVRPATFNKLVRDKIPSVVAAGGELARISHLPPEQLATALKIKLVEEAFEARDAPAADLINELADVLEVVDALIETNKIARKALRAVREQKRQKRGGFKKGIVLLETSLSPPADKSSGRSLVTTNEETSGRVVDTNQPVRLEIARPGPFDVRQGRDFVELVQSAAVGLTHPEWHLMSPEKIRVDARTLAESIQWTLEGKREAGVLRLRLKILIGTRQFNLPLDDEDDEDAGEDG